MTWSWTGGWNGLGNRLDQPSRLSRLSTWPWRVVGMGLGHNQVSISPNNLGLGWVGWEGPGQLATNFRFQSYHLAYGWVDGTGLGIDYID
ncbi:hypothetical protein BDV41DRAFT_541440 [Aspergillus transmontanensis]|uniref:Uncharacterized protein n=1 Tax=Aspergillus transmontanensis TaxID=1034304 RepID=A0A5N6VSL2_9EURO|nr:hypothetical protein BDV41DRAFT_541440 [Aspergillus transmontanensis]